MQVLDHGYLKLIESYGSDERIVEAARMSTGKGFLGWGGPCDDCEGSGEVDDRAAFIAKHGESPILKKTCDTCKGKGSVQGDEKLLRYLYENKHSTPFEMAGAIIEVQAPIFVFREWHRHRTQSYNEMSARYIPLPDVNYIPSVERLLANSRDGNKQAGTVRGAAELTEQGAREFQLALAEVYTTQQTLYEQALEAGVPKELARIHLPVGRYSRMRAHANLRNWMAFLTLRMDPKAQWEIREYAAAVCGLLMQAFPRSMALFTENPHG